MLSRRDSIGPGDRKFSRESMAPMPARQGIHILPPWTARTAPSWLRAATTARLPFGCSKWSRSLHLARLCDARFAGGVLQIAFTPEGRYLLTANLNGTLYVIRLAERGVVY